MDTAKTIALIVKVAGWLFLSVAGISSTLQAPERQRLSALLINRHTWHLALNEVRSDRARWIPILLDLTKEQAPQLEGAKRVNLQLGLVELCGQLHINECIPFLVPNIDWQGHGDIQDRSTWTLLGPIWIKPENVILDRYPCIRALQAIGSAALPQLRTLYFSTGNPQQRLAIIFTVGRLHGTQAAEFLHLIEGVADEEKRLARKGYERLKSGASSPD